MQKDAIKETKLSQGEHLLEVKNTVEMLAESKSKRYFSQIKYSQL